jgi:hypothetical protein
LAMEDDEVEAANWNFKFCLEKYPDLDL